MYSRQGKVGCVFPQTIYHMNHSFPPPNNLLKKVDVLPCQGGERMGWSSFSLPPNKQRLHVYSWQGKVGCVFRRQLTICTTVFLHPITFWTRLMFNLVRMWKIWAGPVFPHPLKSKGYMVIHDRVRLAVFFHRRLTICTTVFPQLITICMRLMFNLVRVGKEWAGPVFPHPLTSNFRFYAYSGQGNLRLAEFFPTPLTICTTVFPHVITLCIRLMFNLVRLEKEWASPFSPHPLKSKGYMWIHDRVRLAVFFHRQLTICTTIFPHLITFCLRLMFNLVRVGNVLAGPVFPHPLTSHFGCMRILDRVI